MAIRRNLLVLASVVAMSIVARAADGPPKAEPPKPAPPPERIDPGAGHLPELPFIDPETIKPGHLTPIPDNPPPHEGAMIGLPYIIEPPDLLIVEVLEALPGKPITGEHLVRPDGTISLGFYGEINVQGLTERQAKEKVVHLLRRYLPDDILGLTEIVPTSEPAPSSKMIITPEDLSPPPSVSPPEKPAKPTRPSTGPKKKPASFHGPGEPSLPRTHALFVRTAFSAVPRPDDHTPTLIQVPAGGNITIKIEVNSPTSPFQPPSEEADLGKGAGTKKGPEPEMGPMPGFVERRVAPADTNRVFVDVTAYNSKFYFVQGDVANPGRMPWTGHETVLDALNYSGGLVTSADPKNIHLYRPARAGKPLKVYPIDYNAILHGEATLNYQLFPGDRLIVGRDSMVAATSRGDRVSASFLTTTNDLLYLAFTLRAINLAVPNLTPAQTEALVKEWFALKWKAANQPGGPVPDEATFRELLLKPLQHARDAPAPKK